MDNQKISMPTEAEKQRAIARILDAGLPRRVAFGRELREVFQRIGPRALLFGVGDCLALSLLIWALCLLRPRPASRSHSHAYGGKRPCPTALCKYSPGCSGYC